MGVHFWTPKLALLLTGENEGRQSVGDVVRVGDCIGEGPSLDQLLGLEYRSLRSGTLCVGETMGSTKGKHLDGTGTPTPGNYVPATAIDTPMDKLDVILQEIRESWLAIEQRLGSIMTELGILKDD
ncbi:hypothetical protein NDU88_006036 [Pleurodeles waltl]|uniref:Uncharacterized protein n=1 Tax=Pleurodeles waltl TaxID=8319 RepID=A0AAV7WZZ8_PLEWA|nr:hypothetical protein NDU88_006036 [Pleurodeles waltl]